MTEEEKFEPEILIGKKIFFQPQEHSIKPSIVTLGVIKRHTKAYKRSWTYVGRFDIVVYQVERKGSDFEFPMSYPMIQDLIKSGIHKDGVGLEVKVVM